MADPDAMYDNPRSPRKDDDVKIGDVRTAKQLLGKDYGDEDYEYIGHDPKSEAAANHPEKKGDAEAHREANEAARKFDEKEQKKRAEGKEWGNTKDNPAPTLHDLTFKPTAGTWRKRAEPTS